jgi:hypothetical protein
MDRVAAALTAEQRALLEQTRYRRNTAGPTILRTEQGRPAFSFRDFSGQPLEWTSVHESVDHEEVNAAIRALLSAVYGSAASGVHWAPGFS